MALADIFVLVHRQSFGTEKLQNVYTYQRNAAQSALALVTTWIANVLPSIRQIQCAQIVTLDVSAYSLGNEADNWVTDVNLGGLLTGEQMLPVFNAIGYTFRSSSRAVRPGSKRIAGVPESDQVDGSITNTAYITDMNALKTAYGAAIPPASDTFFANVIVKRVKYNPDSTKPLHFAYRYPETDGELVVAQIAAVKTSTKITHQVSRGNSN